MASSGDSEIYVSDIVRSRRGASSSHVPLRLPKQVISRFSRYR